MQLTKKGKHHLYWVSCVYVVCGSKHGLTTDNMVKQDILKDLHINFIAVTNKLARLDVIIILEVK